MPSIGGGTNFSETVRDTDGVPEGEGIGVAETISFGEGPGVEDSCAKASQTGRTPIKNMKLTLLSIVAALSERRIILATVGGRRYM